MSCSANITNFILSSETRVEQVSCLAVEASREDWHAHVTRGAERWRLSVLGEGSMVDTGEVEGGREGGGEGEREKGEGERREREREGRERERRRERMTTILETLRF